MLCGCVYCGVYFLVFSGLNLAPVYALKGHKAALGNINSELIKFWVS